MNAKRPLFDPSEYLSGNDSSQTMPRTQFANAERSLTVQRSALWAAYGDALGWISELTNDKGLKRRTSGASLEKPLKWTRRIGGPAGVNVPLPVGCYSDDSQLRLATCRAIRTDGFDVEAFAKVELPVWLSYALGGGKSTSAAASNIAKPRVQWFANTFRNWTNSGGNGAAMRIQPHVWSANSPDDPTTFLQDVIRNAICTHSHPIGLSGATIHALALAHAITKGCSPSPEELLDSTNVVADFQMMIENDFEVSNYWLPEFEKSSGAFRDAWNSAINDCRVAIRTAAKASEATGSRGYAEVVNELKLRDPARRGSGMLTAIAAVALTWCESSPEKALIIAANELGTDTDTIATMAGAILGAVSDADPPVDVLDVDLFRSEAKRMSDIAAGLDVSGHKYPDLLHWSAPKTRADSLVSLDEGRLHVLGMGDAEPLDSPVQSRQKDFQWQWIRVDTGQTLLIKRRAKLAMKSIPNVLHQVTQPSHDIQKAETTSGDVRPQSDAARVEEARPTATSQPIPMGNSLPRIPHQSPVEDMVTYLERHNYEDEYIGRALRRMAEKGTMGQIAAFLSVVVDRLQSRRGGFSDREGRTPSDRKP